MAYPAETWAKVKTDYETGNYSVLQLAKKYSISKKAIDKHLKEEGWVKGELKKTIQKKIEESTLELFVKRGMPRERIVELVVKGMIEPDMIKFEGKGDQMMATPVPDWKTRKDYIQEANKMTGGYAAEKKEITGGIQIVPISKEDEEL